MILCFRSTLDGDFAPDASAVNDPYWKIGRVFSFLKLSVELRMDEKCERLSDRMLQRYSKLFVDALNEIKAHLKACVSWRRTTLEGSADATSFNYLADFSTAQNAVASIEILAGAMMGTRKLEQIELAEDADDVHDSTASTASGARGVKKRRHTSGVVRNKKQGARLLTATDEFRVFLQEASRLPCNITTVTCVSHNEIL